MNVPKDSRRGLQRSTFLNALYKRLEGEDGLAKCCAIRALARLGDDTETSVGYLIKALSDADCDVRMDAAAALGKLKAEAALDTLYLHLAQDPEGEVRIEAAKALGHIGSTQATGALLDCLKAEGYPELDLDADDLEAFPSWDVQAEALESLGRLSDASVAGALASFLDDPDNDHMLAAGYRVLGMLDADVARSFLLEKLGEKSDLIRFRAAKSLGLVLSHAEGDGPLSAWAKEIVDGLLVALDDPEPRVRITAAQSLSDLDGEIAIAPIAKLLGDSNEEVRVEIIKVLGKFKGESVRLHVELLLKDPRPAVKRSAVQVLDALCDPASKDVLHPLLTTHDDRLAFDVIGAVGHLAASGCEIQLVRIATDEGRNRDIRMEAVWALGEVLRAAEIAPASTGDEDDLEHDYAGVLERLINVDSGVATAALSALSRAEPSRIETIVVALFNEAVCEEPSEVIAVPEEAVDEATKTSGEGAGFEVPDPSMSTLGAILVRAQADADEVELAAKSPRKRTGKIENDDPRRGLKLMGLRLLGDLEDVGEGALDVLKSFALTEDDEVRCQAMKGLGCKSSRDEKGVFDLLVKGLDDDSRDVRAVALEGLGQSSPSAQIDADVMAAALGKAIRDEDPHIRQRGVTLLSKKDPGAFSSALAETLQDDNQGVARATFEEITPDMISDDTRQALFDVSFRFSGGLCREVGKTFGRLDDDQGIFWYLDTLEKPDRDEYHWVCLDALAEALSFEISTKGQPSGAGVEKIGVR